MTSWNKKKKEKIYHEPLFHAAEPKNHYPNRQDDMNLFGLFAECATIARNFEIGVILGSLLFGILKFSAHVWVVPMQDSPGHLLWMYSLVFLTVWLKSWYCRGRFDIRDDGTIVADFPYVIFGTGSCFHQKFQSYIIHFGGYGILFIGYIIVVLFYNEKSCKVSDAILQAVENSSGIFLCMALYLFRCYYTSSMMNQFIVIITNDKEHEKIEPMKRFVVHVENEEKY